jgi:hypothetical protein
VLPPPRRRRRAAPDPGMPGVTNSLPNSGLLLSRMFWSAQNYSNFRSVVNCNQLKVMVQTDSAGRRVHPLRASPWAALVLLLWHVS